MKAIVNSATNSQEYDIVSYRETFNVNGRVFSMVISQSWLDSSTLDITSIYNFLKDSNLSKVDLINDTGEIDFSLTNNLDTFNLVRQFSEERGKEVELRFVLE